MLPYSEWERDVEDGDGGDGSQDYGWAGKPRRPTVVPFNPFGFPEPLTWKQKFYLYGPQCVLAACIDGGVNFAVAWAMYHNADQVRLWPLPQNTIAGDIAVTTFIQGIVTFCVASGMVNVDLRNHKVDPFPYPWPDTKFGAKKIAGPEQSNTRHGKLWRTFHNEHGLGRGLHFFSGSQVQDILDFSVGFKEFRKRWFWAIWKGSVMSALFWFLLWPISIAILAPLYGGINMAHTWVPMVTKLLYGFLLGLFQNPICAALALGSEDAVREHLRKRQKIEWTEMLKSSKGYNTTVGERVRRSIDSPRRSAQISSRNHLPMSPSMTSHEKLAGGGNSPIVQRAPSPPPASSQHYRSVSIGGSTAKVLVNRRYSRSAIDVSTIPSLLDSPTSPAMPSPSVKKTSFNSPNPIRGHELPISILGRSDSPIPSKEAARIKSQSSYDVRSSQDITSTPAPISPLHHSSVQDVNNGTKPILPPIDTSTSSSTLRQSMDTYNYPSHKSSPAQVTSFSPRKSKPHSSVRYSLGTDESEQPPPPTTSSGSRTTPTRHVPEKSGNVDVALLKRSLELGRRSSAKSSNVQLDTPD